MPAPQPVLDLIANFAEHLDAYKAGALNETQVRRDFIDPLFSHLGWDMDNKAGYAEAYRDVVHEDKVQVRTGSKDQVKAPDYGFRIGGTRKFFLEAKKPSVRIKDEVSPAYQLRRYAWSAKLPLSILTDFEEFAVYDCRVKPAPTDPASKGRILYFTFDQYAEKWDDIAAIFSKQAILKGSFDKYAAATKGKRGTAAVDDDFLAAIESWRADLARNLALRNPALSQRELNFAVQRVLDRIIFLRICEDRGIEDYERLKKAATDGKGIYPRLVQLFQQADDRYNSGLFHFQVEKGRNEAHDTLTPGLAVDDVLLRKIITGLYYPDSPYEFSVLSADILGSVYEQFLGKVITLTAGHQAKVEDKPEVKKAGGVFYTPVYIVDYIVRQTIGPLLEGKTPKQIARLRILDPACGSGSFLIGAYQFMLDWYHAYYSANDPEKHAKGKDPAIFPGKGGGWVLTTSERKRILLAHLYGVDIDSQAVEVTKLSLLLKVLEGETAQTVQRELIQQRVLPDLGHNIKCGNSLIGPDFYAQPDLPDMDIEDQLRLNAFDWKGKDGFPDIMKDGGFDAVIGNPPYGATLNEVEKGYLKANYKTQNYKFDTYAFFIERAMQILRDSGRVSYITPELWMRLESNQTLRQFIFDHAYLEQVKFYGEGVFAAAVVNTCVFVASKGLGKAPVRIIHNAGEWTISRGDWGKAANLAIDYKVPPAAKTLVSRLKDKTAALGEFGEVIQGLTAYDRYRGQSPELIKSRGYHSATKKDNTYGKWLEGKDVCRYELGWSGEWLSYGPWLGAPREARFFTGERLLFREVPGAGKRIQVTLAKETAYYGHSITPFVLAAGATMKIKFLLGVANSKLLSWYGGLMLPNFGKDVFPKLNPQDIKLLPIRRIDPKNKADVAAHDRIVALVEKRLALPEQLRGAKTPQERTVLERQIETVDAQIDKEVYALYGLTEEEIQLVETTAA